MKWTGLNEIREKYLSFFESKEHLRLQSFSLVPHNDKSLFLINSGMAPMKKYFLGQEVPPKKRVTTCQKCIRTPDIENVGKTARHGTFFEMLGNFSFGDYFKEDAIKFAWEFLTKALEIPAEKLWVTVFESDDEAEKIWVEKIGFPKEKIVRLGKADNFWEHGSGPCGPCSEIHFDRGEKYGPFINFEQASDCDRIIEIWNLVFSQFDNDGKGNYTELENRNIDTGMGLERLACAMQDVNNLFEVDTIQNIMNHISNIAGVKYKEDNKTDISLRVITDHIRSTTFMIGDGILPSNEGRGYVLRRLLRRAARHGRLLGINKPFLYEVVDTVAKENKVAYPELTDKIEYIKKIVLTEEENFAKTIDKGMELLNNLIDNIDGNIISGQDAFKLYDTYGFPIDLTKEIIMEKNLQIDEEEFVNLMEQQRVRARNARATDDAFGFTSDQLNLDGIKTEFTGYAKMQDESVISAIIYDGEQVSTISAPAKVSVITESTPFYAESGGQVADRGQILCPNGILEVCDVKKMNGIIVHHCELISGVANKDEKVTLKVDKKLRRDITRNHTAAHLLQAALINVLGEHVHQAGQLVNAEHLRFDFSHFEPVSEQQL
ncbi:MAG: alanine--tRNA ligase, partial [Oscillospiraceae bacterium]